MTPTEMEAEVRRVALDIFKPQGVEIWLHASIPALNNATPMQFIQAGDGDRVLDLLDQYASGAFA